MQVLTENIHVCKEYDTLSVPVRELMDADGHLELYPEVAGKGYFDIDFGDGRLKLKSRGYIGLIPVSDRVTIRVLPRTPIGNLLYMVWRAGEQLGGIEGFVRGYQEQADVIDRPEEVYFDAFLKTLRAVREAGVLRRYVENETDRELRGRLLVSKTVSWFRARGITHRHVFSVYDHAIDIPENRIIKHTAERLVRHFEADRSRKTVEKIDELRRLLVPFGHVNAAAVQPLDVARQTERLVRGLPATHRFYEGALWLSYLIATRSGIRMEENGRVTFETVIIDAAAVFENYIRKLCAEAARRDGWGCDVLDGNRVMVPLFADTEKYPSKPDVYFRRKGSNLGLVEVKYKPAIKAEDRYEVLAFCEALNVKQAIVVCPKFEPCNDVEVHGTTAGGKRIFMMKIDLAATDMPAEERRFTDLVSQTLGFAPPLP